MNLGKALLATLGSTGPSVIGIPYEGGYYAGKFKDGSATYALVISPKSSGELSGAWSSISQASLATDQINGLSNTNQMVSSNPSSSSVAKPIRLLTIGGKTDWYIPSLNELEIIYRNLKPGTSSNVVGVGANSYSIPEGLAYTATNPAQTTSLAFKSGGVEALEASSYWSSTQESPSSSRNAYIQDMDSGGQYLEGKSSSSPKARAVRRVLL